MGWHKLHVGVLLDEWFLFCLLPVIIYIQEFGELSIKKETSASNDQNEWYQRYVKKRDPPISRVIACPARRDFPYNFDYCIQNYFAIKSILRDYCNPRNNVVREWPNFIAAFCLLGRHTANGNFPQKRGELSLNIPRIVCDNKDPEKQLTISSLIEIWVTFLFCQNLIIPYLSGTSVGLKFVKSRVTIAMEAQESDVACVKGLLGNLTAEEEEELNPKDKRTTLTQSPRSKIYIGTEPHIKIRDFLGPASLINGSCSDHANTELPSWDDVSNTIDLKTTKCVTIAPSKRLSVGQQLTVFYGDDYFDNEKPGTFKCPYCK